MRDGITKLFILDKNPSIGSTDFLAKPLALAKLVKLLLEVLKLLTALRVHTTLVLLNW
jgi:hypothetical protein